MFEKEANDNKPPYAYCSFNTNCELWKDGFEYGYNKANEWHYVKEELPKDEKYVLIYTDLKNTYVARKPKGDKYYFITMRGGYVQISAVIAWKEIVLPEPPKYWDLSTGENNINKED
jgi:hypothetical protein